MTAAGNVCRPMPAHIRIGRARTISFDRCGPYVREPMLGVNGEVLRPGVANVNSVRARET